VLIGIDMLAVQSPTSRHRGIGRLGRNLVGTLLARDRSNRYVLYAHDGLPTDLIPSSPRAAMRTLARDLARGERALHDRMERLARTNPDGLDVLLLLNPLELHEGYGPPSKPLGRLKLASVVHDAIPFLFQERYLAGLPGAATLYRHLESLRRYDLLLTNSDATRADFERLLGLRPGQAVTMGCASEAGFFAPDRGLPIPLATREALYRLGIVRPYVLTVGSMDERKNLRGLIEAFRLLPHRMRAGHQLVVSCGLSKADAEQVRSYAEERGVAEALVLTGEVPDATLRALYQRCAAFVHPSLYEGFGLPVLEAMHCAAAVVAGNNSAQVEVVGDAGLLANAHDPADIAAKTAAILADPDLASRLRARALERSKQFTWDRAADRALEALDRVAGARSSRRHRVDRAPRPRLAIFSPFPPKSSGISDYIVRLIEPWSASYAIDLYHDVGYIPDLGINAHHIGCFDYRLFDRNAAIRPYRGIIYQMGNSYYHRHVYQTMLRHPGLVTLHDFCLSAFQYWYAHLPGAAPDAFEREIAHFCPDRAHEFIPQLPAWALADGGVQVACARRGLYLNRRVFESAEAVVVHSAWCVERVRELFPEYLDRTALIPHGSRAEPVTPEQHAAVRARFDLPPDGLIFGSFGILSRGKMNVEAITAFEAVAREVPAALFLFVGADWEKGEARRQAKDLGLEDRVRFLGRQPASDFSDLLAAVDVGVSLRLPPTDGETSGALLHLLRRGVPTIVTDVGTFADYPDAVVRKVKWERDGLDGLRRAMLELASDRPAREALGRGALDHVAEHHAWERAAAMYAEVIERRHAARATGHRPIPGPHAIASRGAVGARGL
jgi:glycosyltransferase involved in cell wall biosynthesis